MADGPTKKNSRHWTVVPSTVGRGEKAGSVPKIVTASTVPRGISRALRCEMDGMLGPELIAGPEVATPPFFAASVSVVPSDRYAHELNVRAITALCLAVQPYESAIQVPSISNGRGRRLEDE